MSLGHPLGVQPEGNRYLCGAGRHRSALGTLERLSESLTIDVVAWLDGPDLARLSAASGAFYVYGQLEETWKALVLTKWRGAVLPGGSAGGTWQAAYINEALRAAGKPAAPPRGPPVRVSGFFSDLLFKAGLCAATPIDPEWLARDTLPRRSAATLSVAEFVEEFERPNRPFILTGAMSDWPAVSDWTFEALAQRHGDAVFHAGGYDVSRARGGGERCGILLGEAWLAYTALPRTAGPPGRLPPLLLRHGAAGGPAPLPLRLRLRGEVPRSRPSAAPRGGGGRRRVLGAALLLRRPLFSVRR